MSIHRMAVDQQKAFNASGRREERLLPTDLTNLLLHRSVIADDARSVGAVVAVGAADVSHTLLAGVLPLPATRLRWPGTQRPLTTPPRHCGRVRRPVCDTMAAVGPAKALHHGLALAQDGLAANGDPGSGSNLPSRRASGPAGCCWGISHRRVTSRRRVDLLGRAGEVLAENREAPPAPASSPRVGSVAEELARTGR